MTRLHTRVEIQGPVATLVFDRPQVLNAFHNEAMDECDSALREPAADERVRAILVRGEGRAYSGGIDKRASADPREGARLPRLRGCGETRRADPLDNHRPRRNRAGA
jgi:enoyl-CoA hydratase/carnithine racemase